MDLKSASKKRFSRPHGGSSSMLNYCGEGRSIDHPSGWLAGVHTNSPSPPLTGARDRQCCVRVVGIQALSVAVVSAFERGPNVLSRSASKIKRRLGYSSKRNQPWPRCTRFIANFALENSYATALRVNRVTCYLDQLEQRAYSAAGFMPPARAWSDRSRRAPWCSSSSAEHVLFRSRRAARASRRNPRTVRT
jgi:hypothetical protein